MGYITHENSHWKLQKIFLKVSLEVGVNSTCCWFMVVGLWANTKEFMSIWGAHFEGQKLAR